MATYLFGGGVKQPPGTERAISEIVDDLVKASPYLRSQPVDRIIDRLEEASDALPINYLRYWLRGSFLREAMDTALRGSRAAADRFTQLPGTKGEFACFPRGIICHWLAGNVPVLGFLSLVQALLTKNCSIVKVAKNGMEFLPDLLEKLADKELLRSIAVIYIDRDDWEQQQALSSIADARIAWGGMEAIEAVSSLKRRHHTEDLLFGPRTSLAIVGREKVCEKVASRVALDASLLEQRGCNSPHTIFVERGGTATPLQFAEWIAQAMKSQAKRTPKEPLSPGEVGPLLALRAEYEIRGDAFYPSGMEWSVLYSEEDEGLATPAYNRTLFVRPIDDATQTASYCSQLTQSVGLALEEERRDAIAYELMSRGVDRCPTIGGMTHHEVPWDGLFLMDRLVRWCAKPAGLMNQTFY